MPKEFLPSKKEKKVRNQSYQKSPKKAQSQSEVLGQGNVLEKLTLNLLSSIQSQKTIPKNISDNIKRFQNAVIAISILFIFLLSINYFLDLKITSLKKEQEDLSLKVLRYFQTEREAKGLDARIAYYKKKKSEKKKLFDKTSFVFENLFVEIDLNKLDITEDKFTVNIAGESPVSFTNLIYEYLEGNTVSEVILKSANFNSRENIYRVEMEGVFSNE